MRPFTKTWTCMAFLVLAGCAGQQDMSFISSKPVAGAIIGGTVGGLAGSAVGAGTGQLAAVGAGVAAGALIGHQIGVSLEQQQQQQAMGYSLYPPNSYTSGWGPTAYGAPQTTAPQPQPNSGLFGPPLTAMARPDVYAYPVEAYPNNYRPGPAPINGCQRLYTVSPYAPTGYACLGSNGTWYVNE